MKLNELKPRIKRVKSKRAGRGLAGFGGKTAGRGTKGQKSRTGYNIPRRFEGGQTSLIQRSPKQRGFKYSRKFLPIINLADLEKMFQSGDKVTPKILKEKGLVKDIRYGVKILGNGKLNKKLKISGCIFSKSVKKVLTPVQKNKENK